MSEHPTARDRHGDFATEPALDDGGRDVGENLLAERAVDRGGAESTETSSQGEVVLYEVRFPSLPPSHLLLNLLGTRRKKVETIFEFSTKQSAQETET